MNIYIYNSNFSLYDTTHLNPDISDTLIVFGQTLFLSEIFDVFIECPEGFGINYNLEQG